MSAKHHGKASRQRQRDREHQRRVLEEAERVQRRPNGGDSSHREASGTHGRRSGRRRGGRFFPGVALSYLTRDRETESALPCSGLRRGDGAGRS
jgi:hypothetical protein